MENLDDSNWYDSNREIRKKESLKVKSKQRKTKMIQSGIDDYFNMQYKVSNHPDEPDDEETESTDHYQ